MGKMTSLPAQKPTQLWMHHRCWRNARKMPCCHNSDIIWTSVELQRQSSQNREEIGAWLERDIGGTRRCQYTSCVPVPSPASGNVWLLILEECYTNDRAGIWRNNPSKNNGEGEKEKQIAPSASPPPTFFSTVEHRIQTTSGCQSPHTNPSIKATARETISHVRRFMAQGYTPWCLREGPLLVAHKGSTLHTHKETLVLHNMYGKAFCFHLSHPNCYCRYSAPGGLCTQTPNRNLYLTPPQQRKDNAPHSGEEWGEWELHASRFWFYISVSFLYFPILVFLYYLVLYVSAINCVV